MIDVHIINSPDWIENMQRQKDILSQNKNISLFICEPVDGDLFEARRQAYKNGTAEFVSFVDPDDQILDMRIFDLAERTLSRDKTISSIYSRWRSIHEKNPRKITTTQFKKWEPKIHDSWTHPIVHQIIVHRRANIEKTYEDLKGIKWGYLESWIVNAAQMQYGRLEQIDLIAYEWLLRENSARTYDKMKTSEDILIFARKKLQQFNAVYNLKFTSQGTPLAPVV